MTDAELFALGEFVEDRARRALEGDRGPATNEAEWPTCDDPTPMLELLAGRASERKLRCLVCACYYRCGGYGSTAGRGLVQVNKAIDLVESIEVEGDPNSDEARRTFFGEFVRRAQLSSNKESGNFAAVGRCILGPTCATRNTAWALVCCCRVAGYLVAKRSTDPAHLAAEVAEPARQAVLLREIFGNPFRPATFSASWRSATALMLARQMYKSRNFSAMPILADALQDAGCDSADILDHCRGAGPHVRGCWVVDLVLGKE